MEPDIYKQIYFKKLAHMIVGASKKFAGEASRLETQAGFLCFGVEAEHLLIAKPAFPLSSLQLVR